MMFGLMKADIHPTYYPKAKASCACGNSFTVGSTRESLNASICSNCHPFYTGKDKLVDTQGRVDRFKKRLAKAAPKAKK
jgi:large subunit ribosomal protein L31